MAAIPEEDGLTRFEAGELPRSFGRSEPEGLDVASTTGSPDGEPKILLRKALR